MPPQNRSELLLNVVPIPTIRSRRTLIVTAVALQVAILALGWWWTFSLVRSKITEAVREFIIEQNAELANDIAAFFPEMLPEMLTPGTDEWSEIQRIVENLSDLPGDGFACLIDAETGEILCHPDIRADPALYGSRVNFAIEQAQGMSAGQSLTLLEAPNDGVLSGRARVTPLETHFVATKRLGNSNYRLLVHQRTDRIFEIGKETTTVIRIAAAGVGLSVIALSGLAVRTIVRSYDSFYETANKQHEANLKLAQQIQTGTLPTELPVAQGIDIAGWSLPADETGGDTYDIVGLAHDPDDAGPSHITHDNPDRIALLLADATGHGVGPALSVTELRAMLRMGMRGGVPLIKAVQQINEQLHDDLPPGRFITAWIAELDLTSRVLRSVAAGHGPVLIYRARSHTIESLGSDTYPLGVMPELGVSMSVAVALEPGDVVVCYSDGINEACNPQGDQLSNEAVEAIILHHAASDAHTIAQAIRDCNDAHLAGTPPLDDRTVVVVKLA